MSNDIDALIDELVVFVDFASANDHKAMKMLSLDKVKLLLDTLIGIDRAAGRVVDDGRTLGW